MSIDMPESRSVASSVVKTLSSQVGINSIEKHSVKTSDQVLNNPSTVSPYMTKRTPNIPESILPTETKRAKRMLGVMLGTLKKCQDDIDLSTNIIRRREEIDMKINERKRLEREQELAEEEEKRKVRKEQLAMLENQRRLDAEAVLEEITLQKQKREIFYSGYLKTNIASTNLENDQENIKDIFYLPKILTEAQQSILEASKG